MLFTHLESKASSKDLSGFVEDEPNTSKNLFKEGRKRVLLQTIAIQVEMLFPPVSCQGMSIKRSPFRQEVQERII